MCAKCQNWSLKIEHAAYENYPTEFLIEEKLSEVQLQKQIIGKLSMCREELSKTANRMSIIVGNWSSLKKRKKIHKKVD